MYNNKKRARDYSGDIFLIDIGNGYVAPCKNALSWKIIYEPAKNTSSIDVKNLGKPILRLNIALSATKFDEWKLIEKKCPLDEHECGPFFYFRSNDDGSYDIWQHSVDNGGKFLFCTNDPDRVVRLNALAMTSWSAEGVLRRLRNYQDDRPDPNLYVLSPHYVRGPAPKHVLEGRWDPASGEEYGSEHPNAAKILDAMRRGYGTFQGPKYD